MEDVREYERRALAGDAIAVRRLADLAFAGLSRPEGPRAWILCYGPRIEAAFSTEWSAIEWSARAEAALLEGEARRVLEEAIASGDLWEAWEATVRSAKENGRSSPDVFEAPVDPAPRRSEST